ncbi:hypothetical protein Tco_1499253 [Tanacetum coccineum]
MKIQAVLPVDKAQENSLRHLHRFRSALKTFILVVIVLDRKQWPIRGRTPTRALESIQSMADHSQKWNDRSNNKRTRSGNSDGIIAITSKLDSLGCDMKKLKENVHAIQVGCGLCRGTHLDKESRHRVGLLGYYTHIDNRPPFSEKKPILEETISKDIEKSTKRIAKTEEWMQKV